MNRKAETKKEQVLRELVETRDEQTHAQQLMALADH